MNRNITWCVVPDKKNDVHLQLTWKIQNFNKTVREDDFFLSYNVKTPLATDKRDTTHWTMWVNYTYSTKTYDVVIKGDVSTDNMRVKTKFTLEDKDGHKSMIGGDIEFEESKSINGWSDNFAVKDDGPVIIYCELLMNKIDGIKTDEKLQDEMKEMLDNAKEYHSDVVLQCEDGQVDCHKSVLCLKSSYSRICLRVGWWRPGVEKSKSILIRSLAW